MKTSLKTATLIFVLGGGALTAMASTTAPTTDIDGRWDAALLNNGPAVPFRLDISGTGPTLKGTFYDGFHPYDATTSATFDNGTLVLNAEHYLTTITATAEHGELNGEASLQGPSYTIKYGFHAVRHVDSSATNVRAPSIAGSWVIPLDSPSSKGEKAYRFVVQQNGPEVAAAILRIDGDTGAYSGTYQDGKWVLSHFDGHRPGVIEVSPRPDGSLEVIAHNEALVHALQGSDSKGYTEERYGDPTPKYVAYRPEVARAKGLPEPDSFVGHTTARDPNERFTFNFPDVNGRLVSDQDPRFKGKVVLAIVTGTWCPNCHDEAQYLVQLDKKYHDKGLAIVALDFEEPEQQEGLARERAFVKQYGVKYTYLIAGAPAEMWEKVPQLVNLNTWPATVFIGRDGKVKAVHSGFASPATGDFNAQLQKEFTGRVEQLLNEKAPDISASNQARSIAPQS